MRYISDKWRADLRWTSKHTSIAVSRLSRVTCGRQSISSISVHAPPSTSRCNVSPPTRSYPGSPAASTMIAINVRGTPESFAACYRAIASEVEPTLRIHELMRLDQAGADLWLESQYLSRVLAILSAIAPLLSLTAIYSVMSFTVSRRTQEIGVRVALGADRHRIVWTILRRPLAQVGTVLSWAASSYSRYSRDSSRARPLLWRRRGSPRTRCS